MVCKKLDPARFANARQFAAYFGLVPDQESSGDKIRLQGMTKRGDTYIRTLLITAPMRSCNGSRPMAAKVVQKQRLTHGISPYIGCGELLSASCRT